MERLSYSTFESTDKTAAKSPEFRARVLEPMRGEYVARHENILLMGNPGTGKTHTATALGHAVCALGQRPQLG